MKYVISVITILLLISCSGKDSNEEHKHQKTGEAASEHKSIHQQEWEKFNQSKNAYSGDGNYKIIVEKTITVKPESELRFTNPKFTSDGNIIIFSTIDYNELWSYKIDDQSLEKIVDQPNCGNGFKVLSNPDRIIFRTKEPIGNKRSGGVFSINSYDILSKKIEVLYKSEKRLSVPTVITDNIYIIEENEAKCLSTGSKELLSVFPDPFIFVQNDLLIRTLPEKDTLKFRGTDLKFVNAEYSYDGKFVFVLTANNGTLTLNRTNQKFTQNKKASNISKLSGSNLIAFTNETDNGQRTTKSELYLGFIDNDKSIKFPNSEGELRFNPDWSPIDNKIVYNTAEGVIKILSFNLEIDTK